MDHPTRGATDDLSVRLARLQHSTAMLERACEGGAGAAPTPTLATALDPLVEALALLKSVVQEQQRHVAAVKAVNDLLCHSAVARDVTDRLVWQLLTQSLLQELDHQRGR